MGLLDELLDEAVAAAEKQVPSLVAPLVQKAAESGALVVSRLPTVMQPLAQKVLDKIAANKDILGNLSQKAVVGLVSKIELGQGYEAKIVYLATTATHAERMAALDEDSVATQKEAADRNQAWFRFKAFAEEVLFTMGKSAIPLLLAL